jgi:hypothetical protein
VILLSFWFLTAFNATPLRLPAGSRYQYIGAVLLLLVAADLADGVTRESRALILIALGVAVASVAGNLNLMHHDYKLVRGGSTIERGGLAGLEIEAGHVNPAFRLTDRNAGFPYYGSIIAGPYLSAVREFGSPAYSESELAGAPEGARVAADLVMGSVLHPTLRPVPRLPNPEGCSSVKSASGVSPVITVPPLGVFLKAPPGETVSLGLRRFATQSFPVSAGTLRGSALLAIPPDRSSRPWQLQLAATGMVTACRA